MALIDIEMLNDLKNWCDRKRPKYQQIKYVNSRDRVITDATIRKLMYEIDKEDVHGEMYTVFFSAKNFYRNMRNYFTHVAELYMKHPKDDEPITDIIKSIPATGGWLLLIIEDMEELSEQPNAMSEMMDAISHYAQKLANIILIGNGSYREVFSGNENVISYIEKTSSAKEEDGIIMTGLYDQKIDFHAEEENFDSEDKRNPLNFYWYTIYRQLKFGYFEYSYFKLLYKDTYEYLVPRVTKEHVFRNDIQLIKNIGDFGDKEKADFDGGEVWEFDAAQLFTDGFYYALIDYYEDNGDFTSGIVPIYVTLEGKEETEKGLIFSESIYLTINLDTKNLTAKIDKLSEDICKCTYEGESLLEHMDDFDDEDEDE